MKHFYFDTNGKKRKYGIFAPGLDRFILIDSLDYWMVLATADILSSKIPTMAYMLPALDIDINNSNCINYTIFDKTQEKAGVSNIAIARQNPILKFIFNQNKIIEVGLPEDYKSDEKQEILNRLTSFAKYVHKRVYAINLINAFSNAYDRRQFVEKYANLDWYSNFQIKSDRSESEKGIIFELKNALYLASSIEDAEERIKKVWHTRYKEHQWFIVNYYKFLEEPIPDELSELSVFKIESLQTHLC